MSSGARDPHADIQALCDALACALSVIERQGLENPPDWRETIDAISVRLEGQHEQEVIAAGVAIMARNCVMH
jgi:hypothetical protein